MFIRSTLVLASLALPLMAQESGDVKAASTGGAATFYKAYFLDKDQSRSAEATKKALGLYQSFLAANPGHKLAGKAAANAIVLFYATGDVAGNTFTIPVRRCPHAAQCALAPVCPEVVYEAYAQRFGLDEMAPVADAELQALCPELAALTRTA